uniref:Uncharacterized protein n=1 Tax=Chromera velia CCMP2878 TaxID=1169474 RepID=A0A0G4HZ36_9ALVE|eukprot:Cvel_9622.t1-p1 / transcript=Cvel_9622.t1 / gene=Cvel_9622 / organism=Chromera_velia_CCMP2878 / gene_product=hypothetical protein / transcript_product=hypothetical protein / location=Cvel_scaffold559:55855-57714(-) / protein_length=620 / sequence_SO=supercontig / SO=protein_coding / is_pseudo=false
MTIHAPEARTAFRGADGSLAMDHSTQTHAVQNADMSAVTWDAPSPLTAPTPAPPTELCQQRSDAGHVDQGEARADCMERGLSNRHGETGMSKREETAGKEPQGVPYLLVPLWPPKSFQRESPENSDASSTGMRQTVFLPGQKGGVPVGVGADFSPHLIHCHSHTQSLQQEGSESLSKTLSESFVSRNRHNMTKQIMAELPSSLQQPPAATQNVQSVFSSSSNGFHSFSQLPPTPECFQPAAYLAPESETDPSTLQRHAPSPTPPRDGTSSLVCVAGGHPGSQVHSATATAPGEQCPSTPAFPSSSSQHLNTPPNRLHVSLPQQQGTEGGPREPAEPVVPFPRQSQGYQVISQQPSNAHGEASSSSAFAATPAHRTEADSQGPAVTTVTTPLKFRPTNFYSQAAGLSGTQQCGEGSSTAFRIGPLGHQRGGGGEHSQGSAARLTRTVPISAVPVQPQQPAYTASPLRFSSPAAWTVASPSPAAPAAAPVPAAPRMATPQRTRVPTAPSATTPIRASMPAFAAPSACAYSRNESPQPTPLSRPPFRSVMQTAAAAAAAAAQPVQALQQQRQPFVGSPFLVAGRYNATPPPTHPLQPQQHQAFVAQPQQGLRAGLQPYHLHGF